MNATRWSGRSQKISHAHRVAAKGISPPTRPTAARQTSHLNANNTSIKAATYTYNQVISDSNNYIS